jgi:hypothetical protein
MARPVKLYNHSLADGLQPEPNLSGRDLRERAEEVESPYGTGTVCSNRTYVSKYQPDLSKAY